MSLTSSVSNVSAHVGSPEILENLLRFVMIFSRITHNPWSGEHLLVLPGRSHVWG